MANEMSRLVDPIDKVVRDFVYFPRSVIKIDRRLPSQICFIPVVAVDPVNVNNARIDASILGMKLQDGAINRQ